MEPDMQITLYFTLQNVAKKLDNNLKDKLQSIELSKKEINVLKYLNHNNAQSIIDICDSILIPRW